jgi:tRNA modification GTPase
VAQARDAVIGILATIEASVDFPEDVDEPDRSLVALSIEDVISMLGKILADSKAGQIYRDGIRLAIVGRPNVGKSSILNAILRSERSIVTNIPGTTRDVIEESLSIRGVPIRAADTAGLRVTADPVEKIGVERALATMAAADLCILVLDRSVPLRAEDWMAIDRLRGSRMVVALNKCDLPPA